MIDTSNKSNASEKKPLMVNTIKELKIELVRRLGFVDGSGLPNTDAKELKLETFGDENIPEDRQGKITVNFLSSSVLVYVCTTRDEEVWYSKSEKKNQRGAMTFEMKNDELLNISKFFNIEYLVNSIKA